MIANNYENYYFRTDKEKKNGTGFGFGINLSSIIVLNLILLFFRRQKCFL